MRSASGSIETPAITRRTFDWLSHGFVERNVPGRGQRDLLNGFCGDNVGPDETFEGFGRNMTATRDEPVPLMRRI
jgi:hypothetical protein